LILIKELTFFEIDQKVGRAVAQMAACYIIFQHDQRKRRIGQIVQQNFNAGIGERFSNQPHNPHVILEEFGRVVGNSFSVVSIKKLCIDLLLCWFKLATHIILLANKKQLPRRRVVVVFKEIMHPEPEIFQAELAKVLARNGERIEVVIVQISAKLAASFFVFSPEKACRKKEQRYNDRCDDIDAELALESLDHTRAFVGRNKFEVATIAKPPICVSN